MDQPNPNATSEQISPFASEQARLSQLASKVDCFTEEDFLALANATRSTVETWRKRGTGPAYVLLGNRYLYPVASTAAFLQSKVRGRNASGSAKGLL